jgi:replicative DNA helicase
MNNNPNEHIEKTLIGILLSPGDVYKEIIMQIDVHHFEHELCKKTFRIIKKISDENKRPEAMTLLAAWKTSDSFLMPEYLEAISFTQNVTYNEDIPEVLETLKNAFITRSIAKIYYEVGIGLHENKPGRDIAEEIIKRLTNLTQEGIELQKIVEMPELTGNEREAYYRRAELSKSGETSGLNTGIEAINKFTGGFQNEFIIIGARPSMGKTALALFFGMQTGKPGIYFNLEMSQSQLTQRLILQNANERIRSSALRDGTLNQDELIHFEKTIGIVEKKPFKIYDKAGCGVNESIRIIKKQVRLNQCNWVVIDYLQLMTLEGFKGGNREAEVSQISRTLKAAQKELNIPFIVLAQLNRQCEQTADKKPMLSNLRESGSIEQDADTVAFIWRPEYYELKNEETGEPYTNEIFLLFEKHRQGATGSVGFRHNSTMSSFYGMNENPNTFQEIKTNLQPNKNFYEVDREMPF